MRLSPDMRGELPTQLPCLYPGIFRAYIQPGTAPRTGRERAADKVIHGERVHALSGVAGSAADGDEDAEPARQRATVTAGRR